MQIGRKDLLKKNNLKLTKARESIISLLYQTEAPIDANTLFELLTKLKVKIDQATLYRTLNLFTEHGIVKRHEFQEGKARYELSSLPHHHHAVCSGCGDIKDFEACEVDDLKKNLEKSGFEVKDHRLEFYGLCSSCQ